MGGGGHCKSVIDVIETLQTYVIEGIVDQEENIGNKISGYPVIGCDNDLSAISETFKNFMITVGQIKSSVIRTRIFEILKSLNVNLPVIVSPLAHVSKRSIIEEGTVVMHFAMVNSHVSVGYNCIVNSYALIEHDCIIGNHTQISTGAIVNGNVTIGNHCFVGSGATLVQGIEIPDNTIVGAGAIVTKNINKAGIYAGVPAILIK